MKTQLHSFCGRLYTCSTAQSLWWYEVPLPLLCTRAACSLGCGVLRCSGRERRMQFMGLWSLGKSLYDQHSWVFLQLGVTDHFKLVYWIVFIYKYLCLLCANKSFILPKIYMISASITKILFKIAWIICINEFYFHMPGYTELRIHIH